MQRVAAIVLLGAAVAFATWMLVPVLTMSPGAGEPVTAPMSPEVAALNAEVARLETHEVMHRSLPLLARNPFAFASTSGRFRPAVAQPVAPPAPPLPAAPTLPKLVAISTKSTPAGVVRTAALSFGDAVLLAHPGDTVGGLVLRTIDAGAIELVDPSTGTTYRVR